MASYSLFDAQSVSNTRATGICPTVSTEGVGKGEINEQVHSLRNLDGAHGGRSNRFSCGEQVLPEPSEISGSLSHLATHGLHDGRGRSTWSTDQLLGMVIHT